jgi:hypothetical protein
MMLDLTNLTIARVTVFHIPEDLPTKAPGIPTGGLSLVQLAPTAKDMLKMRMVKALGAQSHGIEVSISDTTPSSFFQRGAAALGASDAAFLASASVLATMLAKAQNNVNLKASKLVVIDGTVTSHSRPFLAVVKAELQDALSERAAAAAQAIDHLRDIFMTESQRLYKIGFLQRTVTTPTHLQGVYDSTEHSVHLFDHLMTALETRSAAHYFYSGFLGCQTATSARSRTRDFYNQTMEFINTSGFAEPKRYDLYDALRAELRSNSATISVGGFGAAHMTVIDRTAYSSFMGAKMFPTNSVAKDTEFVKSKLRRRRKINFTSGVTVTTPPDDLNLIRVTANNDGSSTLHIPGTESSRE